MTSNSALSRARTRNQVLIKFPHQFHEILVRCCRPLWVSSAKPSKYPSRESAGQNRMRSFDRREPGFEKTRTGSKRRPLM